MCSSDFALFMQRIKQFILYEFFKTFKNVLMSFEK